MSESNTPSSSPFHVALRRKATFFGRSNWISVTWSCQCCAMQLSRQRQRWTQCGSASSSWCSHAYFLRICCRWHCMLTMQITLHTNTGAHSGTCSAYTHIHIYIYTYVCTYAYGHAVLSPFGRAFEWCSETGRQHSREAGWRVGR